MKKILALFGLILCWGLFPAHTASAGEELPELKVTARNGCSADALQKILDQNQTGEYHLIVELPAGEKNYRWHKTVFVYPNTTLVADPDAHFVKASSYSAMIEAKLNAGYSGYDGNHDISIIGGIWDSEPVAANSKGTETFRFIHCRNITIRNAVLCNVPQGSHLIVLAGVQNATVSDCTFYGYGVGEDGYKSATTPKEAIQLDVVHNSALVPTKQADVVAWDDLPCDSVSITNCYFHNYSRGVGSHTAVAGVMHTNISIVGNRFEHLSDSAIRMYNYKDSIVKDNEISDVVEGILAYTYIETADSNSYFTPLSGIPNPLPENYNLTISGNTISNICMADQTWGDGIRVIGSASRPLTGVNVSGNTIADAQRCGIYVTDAPQIAMRENSVNRTGDHGLRLDKSAGAVISSNTVRDANADGVKVSSSEAITLSDNTIASKSNGIVLATDSICADISGNVIEQYAANVGNYAIHLENSGGNENQTAKVSANVIQGSGKNLISDAIRLTKSSYVTVAGNEITEPAGHGIILDASKNCVIGQSAGGGNTITNARARGIYLTNQSTGGRVQFNEITKSGEEAILVSNTKDAVIKQNELSSKSTGICVDAKSNRCVIQKNTVLSAKKHGILAKGNSRAITVKNNTIKNYGNGGKYYGICLLSAGGTGSQKRTVLCGNKIAGKGKRKTKHGIYLESSPYCDIRSNTIQSVPGHGVYVLNSKKCLIRKNSIEVKSGLRGIWLNSSNYGTISSNTVKNASETRKIVITKSKGCVQRRNK